MNRTKKVAYQGVPGAYSDLAAKKYFNHKQILTCSQPTFKEIFEAVKNGQCDYGIVPVKNTTTGDIQANLNLIHQFQVSIVEKTKLRITHNLIVIPLKNVSKNHRLKMIKKVYSHPQALLQCQQFFYNHPWIKPVKHEDTAGSAKDLSLWKKTDIAAIASREAAKIYQLEILIKGIETKKDNYTYFEIIKKG